MNKTELIAAVAEKATISKKDAENAVSAVIASITESLAGGEKVQIAGFGTFEVRERGERVGRDPRTSAEIKLTDQLTGFLVFIIELRIQICIRCRKASRQSYIFWHLNRSWCHNLVFTHIRHSLSFLFL